MRKQFVTAWTRKGAMIDCPWATKIVKVVDGYMCFESITDYEIWNNQK